MPENPNCTIVFQSEAYDFAMAAYETLVNAHVEVHPRKGEMFVGRVEEPVGQGEHEVSVLFRIITPDGRPTDRARMLDVFTEVERIEVL